MLPLARPKSGRWRATRLLVGNVLGERQCTFIGLPWSIVGTNDFNQDGKAISSGTMLPLARRKSGIGWPQGRGRATVLGENGSVTFVGLPWRIVGTNDFNQDEKARYRRQNASSGETQIWSMDGRKVTSRSTVPARTAALPSSDCHGASSGRGVQPRTVDRRELRQPGGPNSWLAGRHRTSRRSHRTVVSGRSRRVLSTGGRILGLSSWVKSPCSTKTCIAWRNRPAFERR